MSYEVNPEREPTKEMIARCEAAIAQMRRNNVFENLVSQVEEQCLSYEPLRVHLLLWSQARNWEQANEFLEDMKELLILRRIPRTKNYGDTTKEGGE